MSNVNLRRMTVEDVDGVHAIEEATFAKPWSRQSFYEEMTRNVCARYLVAETESGEIIGLTPCSDSGWADYVMVILP